jgi:glutathione S-transferase
MVLAYAGIITDQREVSLKNKPLDLIIASPKATVPVLILENGRVIDESIDIMMWALEQSDPNGWLKPSLKAKSDELVRFNDTRFKPILDNYKYPERSKKKDPVYYRDRAKIFLNQLNSLLMQNRYLLADDITFADVAIFPFIRQFYLVDKQWFERSNYEFLQIWLASFINSALFLLVMEKIG